MDNILHQPAQLEELIVLFSTLPELHQIRLFMFSMPNLFFLYWQNHIYGIVDFQEQLKVCLDKYLCTQYFNSKIIHAKLLCKIIH
ncbi:hypothetical protein RYX36_004325 [Vicia faba]